MLIVEDDAEIRRMMAFHCEIFGLEVTEAADGLAGWALARSTYPDVLVVDLSLRHLDGEQLVERIRRDPRHEAVPVVMVGSVPAGDARVRRLLGQPRVAYHPRRRLASLGEAIDQLLRRTDEEAVLQGSLQPSLSPEVVPPGRDHATRV